MKKLVFAVILLGLLIAGAPIATGVLMERTLRSSMKDLNDMYAETGLGYSIEIVDYDRHLYSSDIEWKVSFGSLSTIYGIDEIVFTDHAEHGFTGVASTTSLDRNPWWQNIVDEQLQGTNPLAIATSYSVFGGVETTFSATPFTLLVEDTPLAIKKAAFVVTADTEMKNFTSSGTWEGMSVENAAYVGPMRFESEFEMSSTFLYDGFFDFQIDEFSVEENQNSFKVSNIAGNYVVDLDEENNTMGAEVTYSLENLQVSDRSYDNAKATFAMRNVDARGYERFMKVYMEKIGEVMALAGQQQDEEARQTAMQQQMAGLGMHIASAFESLLKKDLELSFSDVEITMPEGEVQGDFTLRLKKDMTFMQFAPIAGQPELLLDVVSLDSTAAIPASFGDMAPQLLAPFYPGMQTGLFVKDGDVLRHHAETNDGKLLLNDTEVNLQRQ